MSGMMKMRSYKTVLLLLARHSKRYSGFDLVKKVAYKYKYADEHTIILMLRDLGIVNHDDNYEFNYDWKRVADLMEMAVE